MCFGKLYLTFNINKRPNNLQVKKYQCYITVGILLHIKRKHAVVLNTVFFVGGEMVYVQGGFREYTSIKAFHLKPRSENCRTCTEL